VTQLEPWALAAGLGLAASVAPWATVLTLSVLAAVATGLVDVPGDLQGLGSLWVLGPTLALVVLHVLIHARPIGWSIWELLHTPVRLVLPALLLLLALSGPPGDPRARALDLGGALLLALAVSVLALMLRYGWTISFETMGRRPPHGGMGGAALLALGAAGLTLALMLQAVPTGAVALLLLGIVAALSRPALRVAPMAPGLLRGLAVALGGGQGWRTGDALPRWLRGGPDEEWNPGPDLRGTPAILYSGGDGGGFRSGWLIIDRGTPAFLFRSPARVWEVSLKEAVPVRDVADGSQGTGRLLQRLPLRHQDREVVLATSRGGPPADRIRAEFPVVSETGNL